MNEHKYYPVYECAILGIPRKSITVLIKETEECKKKKEDARMR
jgi:hypothetical protein